MNLNVTEYVSYEDLKVKCEGYTSSSTPPRASLASASAAVYAAWILCALRTAGRLGPAFSSRRADMVNCNTDAVLSFVIGAGGTPASVADIGNHILDVIRSMPLRRVIMVLTSDLIDAYRGFRLIASKWYRSMQQKY